MIAPPADRPFTIEDMRRLQTLLITRAVPAGGMNLEMLDGFLCGLIVAPADVPATEYEPLIWGGNPRWQSSAESIEAEHLLHRLARFIKARIAIDPERQTPIMPLVSMPPRAAADPAAFVASGAASDFPLGAAWAGGFLHAIDLRPAQWRILEQQVEGLPAMIESLLRLIRLDPADGRQAAAPGFRERFNIMAATPAMLRILDHRRRALRGRHAAH